MTSTGFQTNEGISPISRQMSMQQGLKGISQAPQFISTNNETFRSAYKERYWFGIKQVPSTFQIINDKDKADIAATEMNDGNVSEAEAESQTNISTKRFTHVTVPS